MSQDAFNRYTSGGGRPVNEMGGTTPGIEFSESERPAVGQLPAPYLPVARFDSHKRANVVLSAGTPVGLDNQGNLLPAGIPGGHTFTYTALDFATSLVATRNASTVGQATNAAVVAAGNAIMASGLAEVAKFVRPVGVVSYNVFAFEGGFTNTLDNTGVYSLNHDNPTVYGIHNTMAQDLVAVTCDYVLQVPYVFGKNLLSLTAKAMNSTVAGDVAVLTDTAKSYPFAHDELIADATVALNLSGQITSSGVVGSGTLVGLEIVFVSPACGTGDNGVALVGNEFLVLSSGAGGLALSISGSVDPAAVGTAVTLLTLSQKGNTILYTAETEKYIVVKNRNGSNVSATAGSAGVVTFGMKLGAQIKPGDPVVCRVGKFVKFDATRHDADEIVGQCLRVDKSPAKKDYLDRVKTAYERSSTVSHKMAGSATRGVPFLLHLVTDGAQVIKDSAKTLAGVATTGTLTTPPLALVVINMLR